MGKRRGAFPAYRCLSTQVPELNLSRARRRFSTSRRTIDLPIGAFLRGPTFCELCRYLEGHQKRRYPSRYCASKISANNSPSNWFAGRAANEPGVGCARRFCGNPWRHCAPVLEFRHILLLGCSRLIWFRFLSVPNAVSIVTYLFLLGSWVAKW
jgi:hypothetical protein